MKRLHLPAPSPSLAVAVVALFLALSGSVIAAAHLSKNSVGSPEIKNGAVKASDVGDNTLTGDQIKEATLGVVPRAATAGTATAAQAASTAQSAKMADRATSAASADRAASAASADRATSADRAANADRVGGHPAADFTSAQNVFTVAEKFSVGENKVLVERAGLRLVGRCATGEPTLDGGTADVFRITAESSIDGATLVSPDKPNHDPGPVYDGSSPSNFLGPALGESVVAVQIVSTVGTTKVRIPDGSITFTSADGTTIFFGSTAGIRVSFGLQGAACAVAAPVQVTSF